MKKLLAAILFAVSTVVFAAAPGYAPHEDVVWYIDPQDQPVIIEFYKQSCPALDEEHELYEYFHVGVIHTPAGREFFCWTPMNNGLFGILLFDQATGEVDQRVMNPGETDMKRGPAPKPELEYPAVEVTKT